MGRNTATRARTTTSASIKNEWCITSSNARKPWALNWCRRPWNRQLLRSIRIPGVTHTVRIVVLWRRQRDAEPRKILITNRTYWEVHRILKVYRKRWTGTETFHRDGKQHLGMGACQLRSGESQTRHMYLVFLAYSALMGQLQHDRAQEWAHARLTTIGESCRAMFRETLGKTIAWVVEQVMHGQSLSQIKAHLALP